MHPRPLPPQLRPPPCSSACATPQSCPGRQWRPPAAGAAGMSKWLLINHCKCRWGGACCCGTPFLKRGLCSPSWHPPPLRAVGKPTVHVQQLSGIAKCHVPAKQALLLTTRRTSSWCVTSSALSSSSPLCCKGNRSLGQEFCARAST